MASTPLRRFTTNECMKLKKEITVSLNLKVTLYTTAKLFD